MNKNLLSGNENKTKRAHAKQDKIHTKEATKLERQRQQNQQDYNTS